MTERNPKTMYILGAGASVHTGVPLLNDFLFKARNLYMSGVDKAFEKDFKKLFDWIDELRSSAYYMEVNLENLEHVYSLAAMQKHVGLDDNDVIYDACKRVMFYTISKSNPRVKDDNVYKSFLDVLRRSSAYILDPIVTFNYDLCIDYAFSRAFTNTDDQIDYGLDNERHGANLRLLKLHGSMNFTEDETLGVSAKQIDWRQYQQLDEEKLVFIPPTWSKDINDSNGKKKRMANVWRHAIEEAKTVDQIVVIGYSLPQTDTFFQYLLTLGLQKNDRLSRVYVVDPSAEQHGFQERYRKVFSRSLSDRNKLEFLELTFQEFVQGEKPILSCVANNQPIPNYLWDPILKSRDINASTKGKRG